MKIEELHTHNQGSRDGWVPDIIVYHICDCSLEETIHIFQGSEREVSSNYIVGRDGRILQMVDIRDKAWCQGLEPENIPNARSQIVRDRNVNPNLYCVSIEHEGVYKETHGELTAAQEEATIELSKHIIEQIKEYYGTDIQIDREHLIGHCDIDPERRSYCPGERFPFDEIIGTLKKWRENKKESDK